MKRYVRWLFVIPVLALTACATQPPPPLAPQFIVPRSLQTASNLFGYSQAVRVGPWVFVSGQAGYDTKTSSFPHSFNDQVKVAFTNLETVLASAGATIKDVVSITTYQTDMSTFNDAVIERDEFFGDSQPAWTALGVTGFALPAIKFEISAIAYAPKAKTTGKAPAKDAKSDD